MEMYNATVELGEPAEIMAGDRGGELLDRFADYHAALGRSVLGRADLILSLPAESLWQAATAVRALVVDLPVRRIVVESTADFDRRSEAEVPTLLSVSEVARRLGTSRQAVLQRIDSGSLPAVKVGKTWVVPAATVADA